MSQNPMASAWGRTGYQVFACCKYATVAFPSNYTPIAPLTGRKLLSINPPQAEAWGYQHGAPDGAL